MKEGIIEVRPVVVADEPWAPSGKDDFKRPVVVSALVKDGQYQVDLSEDELKQIAEQTGYDLSLRYNPESSHPFWDTKLGQVRLENRTMYFDKSKPLERLRIAVLKKHPICAASRRAFEKGLFPEAEFMITNEEESLDTKAAKVKAKREAVIMAAEMSPAQLQWIIAILRGKTTRNMQANALTIAVDELIEESPEKFLATAKMDADDLKTQAIVKEAIFAGVITRRKNGLFFEGENVGATEGDVIALITDPMNQALKIRMLDKVNDL